MRRFLCAVMTDGTRTVEELMAPYVRGDEGHLEYVDEDEGYREEYESSTLPFAFDPVDESGPVLYPLWGKAPHDGWATADIPASMVYDTFERYMAQLHPGVPVDEYGGHGRWENPNARIEGYVELASPRDADLPSVVFEACVTPDGVWHGRDEAIDRILEADGRYELHVVEYVGRA